MIPADFPWRVPMLARHPNGDKRRLCHEGHTGRWLYVEDSEALWPKYECEPVFTDGATVGALAGAVREAYRLPFLTCVPNVGFDLFPTTWAVVGGHGERVTDHLPTEAEAWLAAWNGRPK